MLAVTHDVEGNALRIAIAAEARVRQMEASSHIVIPDNWGRRYADMAKTVPNCADFATVDLVTALVTRFIDPALGATADGKTWWRTHLN